MKVSGDGAGAVSARPEDDGFDGSEGGDGDGDGAAGVGGGAGSEGFTGPLGCSGWVSFVGGP